MATVVAIRGLSGRGFRVPNSAGDWVTVKEGANTNVDLEMETTRQILSRERDNFVRASGASALLQGLSRRGFRVRPFGGTCTINQANPGVVSITGHGLQAGDVVQFSTTGALPAPLAVGTAYYVHATGLTANAFSVAATAGGTRIETTDAGSGTHTLIPAIKQVVFDRAAAVKVDLNDGATKKALKRSKRDFIAVSAADTQLVNVWGLQDLQASFRVIDPTLTIGSGNAGLTFTPKVGAGENISIEFADLGVDNATEDIAVTDTAIQVSLAVTQNVFASATLSADGTIPSDGETVTVNDRTYRLEGTLSQVGDVKRETSSDVTLDHLVKAINGTGTAGVDYFAGTLPATNVHSANRTGTGATGAIVVTATVPGVAGNSLAKAETSAHLDWDGVGATFTGGVDYALSSTASEVKTAIEADPTANALVTVTLVGTGASNVAVTAPTLLGTDPEPLSLGETVSVDITDPFNVAQLRRHFRAWVEA